MRLASTTRSRRRRVELAWALSLLDLTACGVLPGEEIARCCYVWRLRRRRLSLRSCLVDWRHWCWVALASVDFLRHFNLLTLPYLRDFSLPALSESRHLILLSLSDASLVSLPIRILSDVLFKLPRRGLILLLHLALRLIHRQRAKHLLIVDKASLLHIDLVLVDIVVIFVSINTIVCL